MSNPRMCRADGRFPVKFASVRARGCSRIIGVLLAITAKLLEMNRPKAKGEVNLETSCSAAASDSGRLASVFRGR